MSLTGGIALDMTARAGVVAGRAVDFLAGDGLVLPGVGCRTPGIASAATP